MTIRCGNVLPLDQDPQGRARHLSMGEDCMSCSKSAISADVQKIQAKRKFLGSISGRSATKSILAGRSEVSERGGFAVCGVGYDSGLLIPRLGRRGRGFMKSDRTARTFAIAAVWSNSPALRLQISLDDRYIAFKRCGCHSGHLSHIVVSTQTKAGFKVRVGFKLGRFFVRHRASLQLKAQLR